MGCHGSEDMATRTPQQRQPREALLARPACHTPARHTPPRHTPARHTPAPHACSPRPCSSAIQRHSHPPCAAQPAHPRSLSARSPHPLGRPIRRLRSPRRPRLRSERASGGCPGSSALQRHVRTAAVKTLWADRDDDSRDARHCSARCGLSCCARCGDSDLPTVGPLLPPVTHLSPTCHPLSPTVTQQP